METEDERDDAPGRRTLVATGFVLENHALARKQPDPASADCSQRDRSTLAEGHARTQDGWPEEDFPRTWCAARCITLRRVYQKDRRHADTAIVIPDVTHACHRSPARALSAPLLLVVVAFALLWPNTALGVASTPPGPVTNVEYAATAGGSISLTWTNPTDADLAGVRIYRSTTEGSLGTLMATILVGASPNNAWTDATMAVNTRYFYSLVAYDTSGYANEESIQLDGSVSPQSYGSAVATSPGKAWLFGGCTNCTVLDHINDYDVAADTITRRPVALPSARSHAKATWIGAPYNRVYVFGGHDGSSALTDVLAWDPASGSLAGIASMPGGRVNGMAVYAPNTGKVYYLGGANQHSPTASQRYDTILEFDPASGSMGDTGLRMPQSVHRSAAAYWPGDGCIYWFGGMVANNTNTDRIGRFCPVSRTVGFIPTVLPTTMGETAVATNANEILILGGDTPNGYTAAVHGFNPRTGKLLRHGASLTTAMIGQTPQEMINHSAHLFSTFPLSSRPFRFNPGVVIDARSSTAPATPTNVSPTSGSTTVPTPRLSASAYSDANGDAHWSSQWEVRSDAGTYSAAAWASGTTYTDLTSINVGTSLAAGSHWFRVRYRDVGGVWSAWSSETRFDVSPTWAVHETPTDGGWVRSTTPTLTVRYRHVSTVTGELHYETCEVDAPSPWSSNCTAGYRTGKSLSGLSPGSLGPWQPGTALQEGTTYYWRARSRDDNGVVAPWTLPWRFTIDSIPPTVPSSVKATQNGGGTVTLSWSASTDGGSGGVRYDAEFSLDGITWTVGCAAITALNCKLNGLGGNQQVYFRVVAFDIAGNRSAYGYATSSAGTGYFMRTDTPSTLLTSTPNQAAVVPPGGTQSTSTSVSFGSTARWYLFKPGTSNSTAISGEPPTTPDSTTGAGWVIDDYRGRSIASGSISMQVTVASPSNSGVGTVQCRMFRVTTNGAGSITNSSTAFVQKVDVPGDVIAITSQVRTCTFDGFPQTVTFGPNESLYFEVWINITQGVAGGSTVRLTANDGSSAIQAPTPGTAPAVPVLVSPADLAQVGATPTFTASYSHPAGLAGGIEVQVATDPDFTNVIEQGISPAVASGNDASYVSQTLTAGTHYWRARAVDRGSRTSAWSGARTILVDRPPAAPSNLAPASNATVSGATTSFSSSAFSDPDAGDSHGASHWQVRTDEGSYASPVADSGVTTTALTAWSTGGVPPGSFWFRVRHRDSFGVWSGWSVESRFTRETSITMSIDTTNVTLGSVLPGATGVGSTVVSVSTTQANGYSLGATDQSDTVGVAGPAGDVPDWTGTGSTPTTWGTDSGGFFGVTVRHATGTVNTRLAKWGPGTNTDELDFTANRFAGLKFGTGTTLHSTAEATPTTDTAVVTYRFTTSASSAAGTYSTIVAFSAVANP